MQIKPEDLIQPSDPRFKKIYGYDPIADAKKEREGKERDKEQNKADLEEKYWRMKKEGGLKPWEEKDIKKIVLKEER